MVLCYGISSLQVQEQLTMVVGTYTDGGFLYSNNRLKAEGIAIFAVDDHSGMLTRIRYQPTLAHPCQQGSLRLVRNQPRVSYIKVNRKV